MVLHWARTFRERIGCRDPEWEGSLHQDMVRLCQIVEDLPSYEFLSPVLGELAEELNEVTDRDELARVLGLVAAACEFVHGSIFLLRYGEIVAFDFRVCTTYPRDWLQLYDASAYQTQDPIVLRALNGSEPFLFSDTPNTSLTTDQFWRDVSKAGIGREGCCFVFEGDRGTRVGMSFSTDADSAAVSSTFERYKSDLYQFGQIATEVFIEISAVFAVERSDLSEDEQRFLKRLIKGPSENEYRDMTQGANFERLRISICNKMGVTNLLQAVSVVSRERWFDTMPFDGDEVGKPYSGPLERVPWQPTSTLVVKREEPQR